MIEPTSGPASPRYKVYEAINSERYYQDTRWEGLDDVNSVADFLCYMKRYLDQAMIVNDPTNTIASLHNIRKIVAIGVAAGEKFGMPKREC